jgi:NADH dehydrogenase
LLWAAGVAASPVRRMLGVALDKNGSVKVGHNLCIPGHAEVSLSGDLARVEQADGSTVPGVAPAAKQMGLHVGHVLRDRLDGRDARPGSFRNHDDGSLAAIGRMAAVAQLGKVKLSGFVA